MKREVFILGNTKGLVN